MIWYLFAVVTAIMLLQRAASSLAFAVVLRVTQANKPMDTVDYWFTCVLHVDTDDDAEVKNENRRTAYGVEATV